jgi:hypothetical protein
MFYYGQIIEYVDGTRDLNFEAARKWAEENNAHFLEIEPKEDGVRQFKIIELTLVEKHEEVRLTRASLYAQKKDPITCQIQALRDEEQTDEVVAEIENLKAERAAVVAEIKEQNPYPVEPIEKIEELPVVEESSEAEVVVSETENTIEEID